MKHLKAFSNENFSQLVDLVRQQHKIKDMLTWDISDRLQDVTTSQMTQLTSLLCVFVSVENSENVYTLEGLSNGKTKISKSHPGKLLFVLEAHVQVAVFL